MSLFQNFKKCNFSQQHSKISFQMANTVQIVLMKLPYVQVGPLQAQGSRAVDDEKLEQFTLVTNYM
jgi:hypothetical protein